MKKLALTKMENITGGKLCSDMGIGLSGAFFGPIAGPAVILGVWIGCSIPRATR